VSLPPIYSREKAALPVVYSYSDFLAESGKIWPHVRYAAAEVNLIANLKAIDAAVRGASIQVAIEPYRYWKRRDYSAWELSRLDADRHHDAP
jgi:hypothetical protein